MNKIALITGATSGIGKATAIQFAQNNYQLILTGRRNDRLTALKNELSASYQVEILILNFDVQDNDAVQQALASLPTAWKKIDILVNNAGVAWGAPLEEFPEVGWDKVFDTNVKGVFFLTQKLLPLLEANATKEDPARIINIGSIDGIRTPMFDTHSYGPSKAALHTLTTQMAAKLVKRNIIANAIAPGPFPTYMLSTGIGTGGDVEGTDWDALGRGNPRKRVGTPQDIAGLAIFLSSRAGAFTVGEVIKCDGGQANS